MIDKRLIDAFQAWTDRLELRLYWWGSWCNKHKDISRRERKYYSARYPNITFDIEIYDDKIEIYAYDCITAKNTDRIIEEFQYGLIFEAMSSIMKEYDMEECI